MDDRRQRRGWSSTRARKEEARDGCHHRGPDEAQLRFATTLTFEEYVTAEGWTQATLAACPLCEPGTCGFQRLAPYMRKVPAVAFVARYYCPEQHTTFSLLPDFYASRVPGTLDDIERVVATVEAGGGVEHVADTERPAAAADAVTLGAAVAWLRRRIAWVRALLVTVAGLFPERFAGVERTVRGFRGRLGSSRVLVTLRGICALHLHALPRPLGLNPRLRPVTSGPRGNRQSTGPDPPPRAR
jgi:hypothetical protein